MLSFKEFSIQGTYSSFRLSNESKNVIKNLNIKNPVDPDTLHCTIMYSTVPVPAAYNLTPSVPVSATPMGYTLFGNNLVLLLKSDTLHAIHAQTRMLGATYDYPDYRPHITVSTDNIEDVNNIPLPTEDLIFDLYRTEALDESK